MSNPNKQNAHILGKLKEAQAVVSALVTAGMTVANISVDGLIPRISLLHPPRKRMNVCWKVIRPGKSGGRECEMSALMDGCEIRWTEENYR